MEKKENATNPMKKSTSLLLIAILAYTLIYSIYFAVGPTHLGDDIAYSFLAHYATAGTFMESNGDILSVRLLQIFPIAFFYYIFGAGALSSVAWDILCFTLSVLLAFLIGRELFDDKIGLLSAFLLATFPLAAIYSTTMSDNIPMMFFVSLSFFALIKAIKNKSRSWYFIAGIALMAAPLTIPEGFIWWVMIGSLLIIGLIFRKVPIGNRSSSFSINKKSLYLILGFLIALCVVMTVNYFNSKNAFITFTANIDYYGQTWRPDLIPQPLNTALAFYPNIMFPYHLTSALYNALAYKNFNPVSIITNGYIYGSNTTGFYFYALIPSAAYLILRKKDRKRSALLLFWIVTGILYLEFGPQHITLYPFIYILSHRLDRYLLLIATPVSIVISAALIGSVRASKKKWKHIKFAGSMVAVIFLTVTSLQIIVYMHSIAEAEKLMQYKAAEYIMGLPDNTRIYLDSGYGDLVVYTNFDNLSRFQLGYGGITSCQLIPGNSFVLVPSGKYSSLKYINQSGQMECWWWDKVLSPPESYKSMVLQLSAPDLTTLYYVPANYTPPKMQELNVS
jgi:hypothetical protein